MRNEIGEHQQRVIDTIVRNYHGGQMPGRTPPTRLSHQSPEVRSLAMAMLCQPVGGRPRPSFAECLNRAIARLRAGPAQAQLRAVTPGNAHEFSEAPKRLGRARKVPIGGNVVAFRPRPQQAPSEDRATTWMREMVRSIQRESAARGLPPAPDDPDLRRRVNTRAAARTLRDLQKHEQLGGGTFNAARYDEHWAAAWIELGYAPPPMRSRPAKESPDGR